VLMNMYFFHAKTCINHVCHGLNMSCVPQTQVLKAWFPAGGTVWGGGRNFKRWDLVEDGGHWEQVLGANPCPQSLLSFCFLAAMR
jgi:hypothetical protein